MQGFGNDHTGSVDAYVLVLPLFRPPTGQNDHRSDVRAHLLASVDYDLSTSLQKRSVVGLVAF
jgi:hypothetical protein